MCGFNGYDGASEGPFSLFEGPFSLLGALETLSWRLVGEIFRFFRFLFELRFGFEKTLKKALKMIDFGVQNRAEIVTKSNQK